MTLALGFRARWVALAGAGVLSACSSDVTPFVADLPVAGGHRALVLAVEVDAAQQNEFSVEAFELDNGRFDPRAVAFSLDDEVSVTALLYEASLQDLLLSPGPVSPAPPQAEVRPLPEADDVQRFRIADATASGWQSGDLPDRLREMRIERRLDCQRFRSHVVQLGTEAPVVFMLAVGDAWVLVTTDRAAGAAPAAYLVHRDGTVIQQDNLPALYSGYRQDDGVLWFGGALGSVYEGRFHPEPNPRIEIVGEEQIRSNEDIISLVGPSGPGLRTEQFALTSNRNPDEAWGAFEYFDGQAWSIPGLRRNTPKQAAYIETGLALFTSFYRTEVWGVQDGQEVVQAVPLVLGSAISIAQAPGLGLAIGASVGEIQIRRPEGSWYRAPLPASVAPIEALVPYRDGLVYVLGRTIVEYPGGMSTCPGQFVDAEALAFNPMLSVVGRDVVVSAAGPLPDVTPVLAWFVAE